MVNKNQIDVRFEDAVFYDRKLILNDADVDRLSHIMDFDLLLQLMISFG